MTRQEPRCGGFVNEECDCPEMLPATEIETATSRRRLPPWLWSRTKQMRGEEKAIKFASVAAVLPDAPSEPFLIWRQRRAINDSAVRG
jgi:hypothetical protein